MFGQDKFKDLSPYQKRTLRRKMQTDATKLYNKYVDEDRLKRRKRRRSKRAMATYYEERYLRNLFKRIKAIGDSEPDENIMSNSECSLVTVINTKEFEDVLNESADTVHQDSDVAVYKGSPNTNDGSSKDAEAYLSAKAKEFNELKKQKISPSYGHRKENLSDTSSPLRDQGVAMQINVDSESAHKIAIPFHTGHYLRPTPNRISRRHIDISIVERNSIKHIQTVHKNISNSEGFNKIFTKNSVSSSIQNDDYDRNELLSHSFSTPQVNPSDFAAASLFDIKKIRSNIIPSPSSNRYALRSRNKSKT